MTNNILFTNTTDSADLEKPVLASSLIPEWYKNTESYVGGERKPNGEGGTSGTIKKCMPVFDSIVSGYLILLPADVFVSRKGSQPYFEWADFNLISFHPLEQAELHPTAKGIPFAKFNNPWSIKTPEGYSTLFVQPFHRDLPFTILPAIVDTDQYYAPVNFPMVLNDSEFKGLIPKGTPIAQVIPVKRETWQAQYGTEEDYQAQKAVGQKLQSKFFDKYKTMFRVPKEYK